MSSGKARAGQTEARTVLVVGDATPTRVGAILTLLRPSVLGGARLNILAASSSDDAPMLVLRLQDLGTETSTTSLEATDPLAGVGLTDAFGLLRRAFRLGESDQHRFAAWAALAADAYSVDPARFPPLSTRRITELAGDTGEAADATAAVEEHVGPQGNRYQAGSLTFRSAALLNQLRDVGGEPETLPDEGARLVTVALQPATDPVVRLRIASALHGCRQADATVIYDIDRWPADLLLEHVTKSRGLLILATTRLDRFGGTEGYELGQLAAACGTLIVTRLGTGTDVRAAAALLSSRTGEVVPSREIADLGGARALVVTPRSRKVVRQKVTRSGLA